MSLCEILSRRGDLGMTTREMQCSFRNMRARLTKDFTFEAAQTLPNAPEGHKCRKMHGHSFKIEVSVEGEVDPETGWVYDHAEIGAAMKPLLEKLDHSYLNEIEGLENPTIENMAAWFWKKLQPKCAGLCEIVIHETPTARCVYRGE
jgi:6-pyruvoyltetrahydropterin/6-carboxytetrahydropterin synthase